MTEFKWGTFIGTEERDKLAKEKADKSRNSWKPILHLHIIFFGVLLFAIAFCFLVNILFPGNLNYFIAKYLGY